MAYYHQAGVVVPFVQKFYKQMIVVIAGLFIASMVAMTLNASAAPVTIVVTSGDTQGWSTADTRPGGAVNFVSDATSPLPNGALQLTTNNTTTSKAQYMHAADATPLSSITNLSYKTKYVSGPTFAAASYQVVVDLNGNSTPGGFATLVYEPYQNGTVDISGVWQTWDVNAGQLWSTRTFTDGTCSTTNGAGGAPFYTIASLSSACPNAVVNDFVVNIGSNNPSYVVSTDAVVFNETTYDFELDTTAPTANLVFPTPGPAATSFQVVFSESVIEAEAEDPANYFLNNWPGAGGSGNLLGDATVVYDNLTKTATVTFTNAGWYVSPEQEWGVEDIHDLANNLLNPSPTTETSTPMVAPLAPGTPTTPSPTLSSSQTWTWTAATDPTVVGVDASGVSYYQVSVDGGTWTNIGNVLTYATNFTNDTHSLSVRAVDNAGNTGAEATGQVVVFGDKDDCKNGGWALLGATFKNQGQCVSHFASNGTSTAARTKNQ